MRIASLGSGSKGNGTLVEEDTTCLLIDCGFSLKETEARLVRLGKNPQQITAILVTHEHGDHAAGVMPLARKYGIPVYATKGTARAGSWLEYDVHYVDVHAAFSVDALFVQPVAVPHDAKEPSQFVIGNGGKRFGLLTDVGSVTAHMLTEYRGCDAYFVECNHDVQLLQNGSYPEPLKQRVGGDYGHLNNEQAAGFLKAVISDKTEHIVIGHLSGKNNTPAHALQAVVGALGCAHSDVTVASQQQGFAWRNI